MSHLIFVYGTLKEGFPNFSLNPGRRRPGTFRTRQPFPFYVVRLPLEDRAPWLVNQPGQGERVTGQIFEVDDATLRSMDRFEEVGLPTGYVRLELELERVASADSADSMMPTDPVDAVDPPGHVMRAHAYLKAPDQLAHCLQVEGPFADYITELAVGYLLELP